VEDREEDFIEMMHYKASGEYMNSDTTKGLIEKVEIDPQFNIVVSGARLLSASILLSTYLLCFMVMRCVSQRRVMGTVCYGFRLKDYQIPYAVVTDGENAGYNMLTGSLVSDNQCSPDS
jgi:hypothetical protein